MRPFISEDLSSESETERANTPAWHPLLTGFIVTSSERARSGGSGEGHGAVNGVIFMLHLLASLRTQKFALWQRLNEPNHTVLSSVFLARPSSLMGIQRSIPQRGLADPAFGQ